MILKALLFLLEPLFAPNETSKTLSIRINNDTIKETKESFDIKLVDELKTAQLFDDESFVSFVVLNDDPTNPQLTISDGQVQKVAALDSNNSSSNFDYFDETATFNITSLVSGGSVSFDGKTINSDEKFTLTQVKNFG